MTKAKKMTSRAGKRRTEWALRAGLASTSRILIERHCDENGLTFDGSPAAWRDVARFDSYNDAERVLRVLQASEESR
jgi:hypothetical protein